MFKAHFMKPFIFSQQICRAFFIGVSTRFRNQRLLPNNSFIAEDVCFRYLLNLYAVLNHGWPIVSLGYRYRYSMKAETTRLCVYPKDVQRITGKSERWGRMLLLKIRAAIKKDDHQFVTVKEFCAYTGFSIEEVQTALID